MSYLFKLSTATILTVCFSLMTFPTFKELNSLAEKGAQQNAEAAQQQGEILIPSQASIEAFPKITPEEQQAVIFAQLVAKHITENQEAINTMQKQLSQKKQFLRALYEYLIKQPFLYLIAPLKKIGSIVLAITYLVIIFIVLQRLGLLDWALKLVPVAFEKFMVTLEIALKAAGAPQGIVIAVHAINMAGAAILRWILLGQEPPTGEPKSGWNWGDLFS